MNIKRGLKRLWVVGSVLWAIGVIGMTISTFPEKPKETKRVEIKRGDFYRDNNFSEKTTLEKNDHLTRQAVETILESSRKKKEELLRKARKRIYEEKKNKSLLSLLKGLGVLVFMWGLLYTGFWVGSGFSGDNKMKDDTNE